MRRKNRQIKMIVDLPEDYADDESFMEDFGETLNEHGWSMVVETDEEEKITIPINRITLGDIEIEPEEE